MKKLRIPAVIYLLFLASNAFGAERAPLVIVGEKGLKYTSTKGGDRIPDFSYCGYRGGGVSLPEAKGVVLIKPNKTGDDTKRIQEALDKAGKRRPGRGGMRGAVLLSAGTYRVSGTLRMTQSGVVLRGQGQGEDGTVIIATGTNKRSLIEIRGARRGGQETGGSRRAIADERVPVGATSLTLAPGKSLKRGDTIIVFRAVNQEWISALGTDKLNRGPDDDVKNWTTKEYGLPFERIVTAVKGNTITVNSPIVCAIEKKYGGGYVYKHKPDLRASNIGVEDLRMVSEYQKGKQTSDENHAWDGIKIMFTVDSWVKNVTAVFFGYSCVNISSSSSQITVQDCACIDPVSRIHGGRRYSFALAGQRCLIQRCYTRLGRHDYVMHARVPGPNVFLDCVADNTRSDSGPHHRWSTGTLYDNIKCGRLNVQWRGRSGTGHGWAGANMVFWNCRTTGIDCDKPPTANNYTIGCTGKITGKGYVESAGKPVNPRSLYLQQLKERLGEKALKAVTIPEQLDGPIDDLVREKRAPRAKSLYY